MSFDGFLLLVFALILGSISGCTAQTEALAAPTDPMAIAEKALQESPSFENYINLGLVAAGRGERQKALTAYLKARDMSPKSPLAWNNVCAELNAQGRPHEAVINCERAVELEPSFVLAKKNLELTRLKLREELKVQKK